MGLLETKALALAERPLGYHPCDIGILTCGSESSRGTLLRFNHSNRNPKTTFIAYGAETRKSTLADSSQKVIEWYREKKLMPKEYYLVVGRFVDVLLLTNETRWQVNFFFTTL